MGLLKKNDKVGLIASVPLFAGCSKKGLEKIAKIADEIDLPDGHALTRQGASGREFFVIVSGTVEVERDGDVVASMGAGDFLGEVALLVDQPRNATVKATSPVTVLVVNDRDFRVLLRENPDIQLTILEALAQRLAPTAT